MILQILKTSFLFLSFLIVFSLSQETASIDLSNFFNGFEGTFVILDAQNNTIDRYNIPQSEERISPCSTYKIAHSLFALDSGILKDANHVLKWDGNYRRVSEWNTNLTLREAIAVSAVPHFMHLANKIGSRRMKDYISKTNYGNQDISGGITKFWLENSLKISAVEQVKFVNSMLQYRLPVSKHAVDTVKEVLKVGTTPKGVLYGKTGSGVDKSSGLKLGWFVGFVESENKIYIFATNIKSSKKSNGRKAKEITKNILSYMNFL